MARAPWAVRLRSPDSGLRGVRSERSLTKTLKKSKCHNCISVRDTFFQLGISTLHTKPFYSRGCSRRRPPPRVPGPAALEPDKSVVLGGRWRTPRRGRQMRRGPLHTADGLVISVVCVADALGVGGRALASKGACPELGRGAELLVVVPLRGHAGGWG